MKKIFEEEPQFFLDSQKQTFADCGFFSVLYISKLWFIGNKVSGAINKKQTFAYFSVL